MTQEIAKKSNIYIHCLMLFTVVLVATSFPVGVAITHALPPEVMMFIRFFIAAILFAPYVFFKNRLLIPPRKTLLGYALLSIPLVVFFWCMFESLRYTSAVNTGALYTVVPAITAIFAYILNKEVSTNIRSMGLLLGTMGALWIVFRGDINALLTLDSNKGDIIFLIGCLFLALYNPLVKKLYSGEHMAVMTFWVILFGSVWLFILSARHLLEIEWGLVTGKVYAGILYLSIFTTLITFFLLQLSTIRIGSTKVAAYGFLTPVFVIALSVLFGQSTFEWQTLPGIFLVIIAMLLIQKNTQRVPLN